VTSSDLLPLLSGAPAAVVSDALDRLGRREKVLDPAIRPLWPQARLADVAEAVVAKHRLEGNARADLLAGMSIREVWTKYGVL